MNLNRIESHTARSAVPIGNSGPMLDEADDQQENLRAVLRQAFEQLEQVIVTNKENSVEIERLKGRVTQLSQQLLARDMLLNGKDNKIQELSREIDNMQKIIDIESQIKQLEGELSSHMYISTGCTAAWYVETLGFIKLSFICPWIGVPLAVASGAWTLAANTSLYRNYQIYTDEELDLKKGLDPVAKELDFSSVAMGWSSLGYYPRRILGIKNKIAQLKEIIIQKK